MQKVHVPLTPELAAKIEQTGVTLTMAANSGLGSSQIRVGVLDLRTGRIGVTDILADIDREVPNHK